nr:glycogen/starch/alpha-glucan phosphorylase [Streptococcus hyointestinalis]
MYGVLEDASQLAKVLDHADDNADHPKLAAIRHNNNLTLTRHFIENKGAGPDEYWIKDTPIRRFPPNKRHQMNLLTDIHRIVAIRRPDQPILQHPETFGPDIGPANIIAPDYIHRLLCLLKLKKADSEIHPVSYLHVAENYADTGADHIIPAIDVLKQIYLAYQEG